MTLDDDGTARELERFRSIVLAWLDANAEPDRTASDGAFGVGSDRVAVFHDLPHAEEQALLDRVTAWQRTKYDGGFGALSWPVELGGAGLSSAHEDVFSAEESSYDVPPPHELAVRDAPPRGADPPAVRHAGAGRRALRPLLRGDALCCQLFSEPEAGSDLSGLATRAVRDGDDWIISGQKVWSSGAQFAQWGELIARTDPDVPKQAGLTAFLLPMDAPGVEVRPLRQMSGGSSFCEVFLDEVRVPDTLRLGDVGQGVEGGPGHPRLRAWPQRREPARSEGAGVSWSPSRGRSAATAIRPSGACSPTSASRRRSLRCPRNATT